MSKVPHCPAQPPALSGTPGIFLEEVVQLIVPQEPVELAKHPADPYRQHQL
jgi:hypothetical protein